VRRACPPGLIRGADTLAAVAEVLGVPAESFAYLATDMRAMMGAWSKATGKRRSGADARKMRSQVKALLEARGVLRRGAPGVRLEVLRAEDEGEEE
jgi:Zn-dependent peptidase ImmA (M78 family)